MPPNESSALDRDADGLGDAFSHLLAGARHGDEAAFLALFGAYQPRLIRYLWALAGDAADDLAADTWLNVVRGLGGFSGGEQEFRAWLYTIARHRRADVSRSLRRRPPAIPIDPLADRDRLDATTEESVEAAVGEIMSTEAAIRLVRGLPQDQADVVLLRHVVGLDVAGTAQVLGKSPGAVRILAHRGLRRLADELGASHAEALSRGGGR